jgi:hypothetical protein
MPNLDEKLSAWEERMKRKEEQEKAEAAAAAEAERKRIEQSAALQRGWHERRTQ